MPKKKAKLSKKRMDKFGADREGDQSPTRMGRKHHHHHANKKKEKKEKPPKEKDLGTPLDSVVLEVVNPVNKAEV